MTRLGMTKERFLLIYEGEHKMPGAANELELYLRKQVYMLFKNYNAYTSLALKYERKISRQALYGPSVTYYDAFSEIDALMKLKAKKVKFLNYKLLADELMENLPGNEGELVRMFFVLRKNSNVLSLLHGTDTKGIFRTLNRAIISSSKYLLRKSNSYYMQIIDSIQL